MLRYFCQVKRLGFAVGVLLSAVLSQAENIAVPDPALNLGSFFAADTSCGTYSFIDDVYFMDSGANRPFVLPSGDQVDGRMRMQVRVDPVSGVRPGGVPLVNIEQGQILMVGSSDTLPISNEAVVIARVIGAQFQTPFAPSINFLAAVDYLHPAVLAQTGPVGHLELIYYDPPWFGSGEWQEERPPQTDCFASSPELYLRAAPLDGPSPITFRVIGNTLSFPANVCPFASGRVPAPINITYTFDANTRDADPDPAVGRYLSCDDTYGSRSGTSVAVDGVSWRSACVVITVENDVLSGVSTVDRYTVGIWGDERLSGTVMSLTSADATAFSDDSLPLSPPAFGAGGTFIADFPTVIGLNPGFTTCEFPVTVTNLLQVGDVDSDGVADTVDNCVNVYNARQRDSNGDGFGNACDPDLNGDLNTNVQDLGLLRSAFFGTGNEDADFNSDGLVNVIDLGIMRNRFFQPPGPRGADL